MSQKIPIYIPTYISDAAYKPARVLPRLFFYNGMVECETWYLESGSFTESGVTIAQDAFPSLLYNPKTRLLNCSAIIPLADYTKMELNDIVNFRGNYYHLRAINDYSLKTGECQLQLLGPIIADSFDAAIANTPVTNPCCTPTLNSVIQSGGSINLSFTLGTGGTCSNCVATTIQTSTDNINWSGNNTAGCTSPRTLSVPSVPTYYRIITNCDGSTTSDPSNSILFTP